MNRTLALLYGFVCYAMFLLTFLYAIGFVGNLLVPKSIDSGPPSGTAESLIINILLLGLFAVQHTFMARPAFKRWWTKIVPEPVERSTFVLATNLVLILLFWQWRPLTGVLWSVEQGPANGILVGLFWLGWLIVLLSTFMIDHFDLFGLRQVWLYFRHQDYRHIEFRTTYFYKYLRHPIMAGFIIAFWATPHMTTGHLLFAVATTGYILIGIQFEEHDLRRFIGQAYEDYRRCVPMLIPFLGKRKAQTGSVPKIKEQI